MSAHTPGPWFRLCQPQESGEQVFAEDEHATFCIAELSGKYPERHANALLIMAAPELLEACKAAVAAAAHGTFDRIVAAAEMCKAAVAKVEDAS